MACFFYLNVQLTSPLSLSAAAARNKYIIFPGQYMLKQMWLDKQCVFVGMYDLSYLSRPAKKQQSVKEMTTGERERDNIA